MWLTFLTNWTCLSWPWRHILSIHAPPNLQPLQNRMFSWLRKILLKRPSKLHGRLRRKSARGRRVASGNRVRSGQRALEATGSNLRVVQPPQSQLFPTKKNKTESQPWSQFFWQEKVRIYEKYWKIMRKFTIYNKFHNLQKSNLQIYKHISRHTQMPNICKLQFSNFLNIIFYMNFFTCASKSWIFKVGEVTNFFINWILYLRKLCKVHNL